MKNKRGYTLLQLLLAFMLLLSMAGCSIIAKNDTTNQTIKNGLDKELSTTKTDLPESTQQNINSKQEPTPTPTASPQPSQTPAPTLHSIEIDPAAGNEYYAYALHAASKNAKGNIMAVLYDIDGCGYPEMIVVDDGTPEAVEHWAAVANGFKIMVYDAKKADDGPGVMLLEDVTHATYLVYVTKNNGIMISDTFEGLAYRVLRYQNGTLTQAAELVDGYYGGETYYAVNGKESSQSQFLSQLKQYGVNQILCGIGQGALNREVLPIQDDVDRILDMKSFGASSSVATHTGAGLTEEAYRKLQPHLAQMLYLYLESGFEPGTDPYETLTLDDVQSFAYSVCADLEPLIATNGLAQIGLKKGDAFIKDGYIYVPVSYVEEKLNSIFGKDALHACGVSLFNCMYDCVIKDGRYRCQLGDKMLVDYEIIPPEAFPVLMDDNNTIKLDVRVALLDWDEENETEDWVETHNVLEVGLQPDAGSEFGCNIVSFRMTTGK